MPRMERREFLRLSISACAIPLARAQGAQSAVEKPTFPVRGWPVVPQRRTSRRRRLGADGIHRRRVVRRTAEDRRWLGEVLPLVRSVRTVDDRRCAEVASRPARCLAHSSPPAAARSTLRAEAWDRRFFQFQGCEPIGDQLWRLDLFHELGLRVLQITHHNDNAWGGGAIEKTWTGLTKTGHGGARAVECARHHSGSFARLGPDVARRPQGQQEAR